MGNSRRLYALYLRLFARRFCRSNELGMAAGVVALRSTSQSRDLRPRWKESLLTSPHCLMHGSSGAYPHCSSEGKHKSTRAAGKRVSRPRGSTN